MARTYALELKVAGRRCVVIGGGAVAARKAAGLLEAGADVVVVAPAVCDELRALTGVKVRGSAYRPEDLAGATLVLACTDDAALNRQVAADASVTGVWCNVANDPEAGDFYVPAVLRRGDLTVAVGTSGASPQLAVTVRQSLESQFGPEYAILTEELSRARRVVREQVADGAIRRRIFQTLCSECSLKLLRTRPREAWRAWFERVIAYRMRGDQTMPEA